uniref:Uncharacterized protein n=1 Tax=viral metagenome TaxID=1070528 RepID=A0A6C0BER6_9ZZZZ
MVCYCSEKKIIYIHIPKCAGLTIEKILVSMYGFKYFTFPKDSSVEELVRYPFLNDPRAKMGLFRYILKYSNESKIYDLNSFFKFTFVRNPFDRAISSVKYLSDRMECSEIRKLEPERYIKNFYISCLSSTYLYFHFILSQEDCIKDLDGNIKMDFIGRFENLIPDLKFLLFDKLGFEVKDINNIHENKSDDNSTFFCKEDVDKIILDINRSDFYTFHYI